jgi:CRP/FNR family transcriptional regulator, dissimilatory nitrate respiration regulator
MITIIILIDCNHDAEPQLRGLEIRMIDEVTWRTLVTSERLFAALPQRFRSDVTSRQLEKGDVVFRRGDRPRFMFAVLSGETRLMRISPAGGQVILQRARRGLLAEASLDQSRYHCDAIAVLPTQLACLQRSKFREALADDAFRSSWMTHLLQELRRVRAQSERLSLHTARDRIIHYIEVEGSNGRVVLSQSKKDWAAELGLTHEALYRALSLMVRMGELSVVGRCRLQELALSWSPDRASTAKNKGCADLPAPRRVRAASA